VQGLRIPAQVRGRPYRLAVLYPRLGAAACLTCVISGVPIFDAPPIGEGRGGWRQYPQGLSGIRHGRWQPPDRRVQGPLPWDKEESVMGVAKKAKRGAKSIKRDAKKGSGKVKNKGKKAKNAAKH
jgi:hypothetical protein